jgi:glycosyltransferase involved in cell wall biosynthesis
MKILMLTQYLAIGGLEKMVFLLAKGLKANSQEVGVFAYDRASARVTLEPLFRENNIPVEICPKSTGLSLRTVKQISRSVIENSYDVIHTHDLGPLIYGILVKFYILIVYWKRIPVIHTQHSFVHINDGWRYSVYEKIFTRLANQVCVVNEALLKWYVPLKVPTDAIVVIPNGVVFQNKITDATEKTQLKEKLLANLLLKNRNLIGKNWVLSLGRTSQAKGTFDLLKIWSQLDKTIQSETCLIIVGPYRSEQIRQELTQVLEKLPMNEHVHFIGPSLEPEKWIQAADVFISASSFEGHPLALIETLGSGISALVSDIPGHQMPINTVSYFPLGNTEKAALLLTNLLNEKATNEEAFRNIYWQKGNYFRENFSYLKMTEMYLKLYLNLKPK